ncbi:MAG: thrombospondin type 3 repeat-containing protein [Gammaproteobacteria bacterium]|nr:thrombospondin type 3 repeat-containing protein [Gammaproteobacteria bacterium]MBQ0773490.1 thrombospondin type 3 repeat-containing protein [Gammaproteobacteria bacterium]
MVSYRHFFVLIFVLALSGCKLEVFVEGEGVVSASPQGAACDASDAPLCYDYEEGTSVEIRAQPASGYRIVSWSDQSCGVSETCRVLIEDDTQLTVIFSPADTDGDGIVDVDDAFPNDPSEWADADTDGVGDNTDLCPQTPAGEAVDPQGCSVPPADSDGDSVDDSLDQCPMTSAGMAVDEQGCADYQRDSDNDGVTDDLDVCANTPEGVTVSAQGCAPFQLDSDADGVNDALDQCPVTEPGLAVDVNGCADNQKDSDSDGINDAADQCPATPTGEDVDEFGCAASQKDLDADGVNDALDQCPATLPDMPVDAQGCALNQLDADGDSINDALDQCPSTPVGEAVDAFGCAQSQKDDDLDGVDNTLDQCPLTETGTSVDAHGCAENQKDDDEDGVNNVLDQCPATPSGETVDAEGCAESQKDEDGDAVIDSLDQCPNTQEGLLVDENGCAANQKDDDADGITNDLDICPSTAVGQVVNGQGCALSQLDSDADSVTDDLDQCPATPLNEDVDANGCALSQLDSDADGVMDDNDQCPLTELGLPVDGDGCADNQKDSDSDGVNDALDQCPVTQSGASVDADGCSDAQKDTDSDGISDQHDICPATEAGWDVDILGCAENQKDGDSDGVNNHMDQCPNTDSGLTVNAQGCAQNQLDSDNDGINDQLDLCPATESGLPVDANGCADNQEDSDSDGVNDALDQCPDTAFGAAVDAAGCSATQRDSDGDGVNDAQDACPATESGLPVNAQGCAENQQDDDSDGVVNTADQCPATESGLAVDAAGCADNQKDTDNDGINDALDQCPATESGLAVNAEGCATNQVDTDADGVVDAYDVCPATAAGHAVDILGCSAEQRDADGDGVSDALDQCPATPAGAPVNANGCAPAQLDTDADGVSDAEDTCPATASGLSVDENGCAASQKDTDSDGVSDALDQCPATEAGAQVNADGCAQEQLDADNDGIIDALDQCPATGLGLPVDAQGCADDQRDTDGDGVFDALDQCPATQPGAAVDSTGCANNQKDTDSDGINDALDQCPNTSQGLSVDEYGCAPSQKDGDNDGVNDAIDQCPTTEAGQAVDAQGCALNQSDLDGDLINDALDQCPNTPAGEVVDQYGCSSSQKDTDQDGVSNAQDQCPVTEAGLSVDAQGCADNQRDADIDGVNDALDQCPATLVGMAVDAQGCADVQKDTDNDGVTDDLDQCPSSSSSYPSDADGCGQNQRDDDNDGVLNSSDSCPTTPAGSGVDRWGCANSERDSDADGVLEEHDICPLSRRYQSVDSDGCGHDQRTGEFLQQTNIQVVFEDFDDGYYQAGAPRHYERDAVTGIVYDRTIGGAWADVPLGTSGNLRASEDACAALELGGISNWDLPEEWELARLMDFSNVGTSANNGLLPQIFINRQTGNLFFDNGSEKSLDFSDGLLSQNVSGTAICYAGTSDYGPDFKTKTSPDTIVDAKYQLMWQDDVSFLSQKFTWSEALQHCEALVLDGYDDWRLPNATEAYVLMAEIMGNSYIRVENKSGYNDPWWSSTTAPSSVSSAISMWSIFGRGQHQVSLKGANKLARCVRTMPYERPVVIHQGDVSMLSNETVTLDASASHSSAGAIINYSWQSVEFYVSGQGSATPRIVNPPVGEHLVHLTVTDSNYVKTTATFTVTVLAGNQPPVAVFDLPEAVYYGDTVPLDGRQSHDADGAINQYRWYVNGVTLSYSSVASLSSNYYQEGENTVRLQVRDNEGEYSEETQTFSVIVDADRDGVVDGSDLCPNTSPGALTDEYGCSISNTLTTCPVNPVLNDDGFQDSYPDGNIDYIGHSYSSVADIERAFNNARYKDKAADQYLKMPAQQVWDALSVQEQGLFLVNAERKSHGLKPFAGVSDEVVQVAKAYADLIREGNVVIDHYYVDANGNHTPHDRLAENSIIAAHQDAGIFPESIFSRSGMPSANGMTESELLVAAIYGWIYADANPLSGNAWGHRDHLLQTGLNENGGAESDEGLLGFGLSVGLYDPGYSNSAYYGGVVVLNTIDPSASWQAPVTGIDITEAQQCNNYVSLSFGDFDLASADVVSITISPFDFNLPVGGTQSLTVTGRTGSDGVVDLTPYAEFAADDLSIVAINASTATGVNTGYAYLSASVDGIRSNRARVTVGQPAVTDNLADTSAEQFVGLIPQDATVQNYDPKAVTVYSGVVYDDNRQPLSGVRVSILNAPEYGTAETAAYYSDSGRFKLPAGSGEQTLVYRKQGYLTVHRTVVGGSSSWATAPDVVLLEQDDKTTAIDLTSGIAQRHTSTVVTDVFGARATTLVFNGVTRATVKAKDGSSYELDNFLVRATEYVVPESMPAELPKESAFTYCSELELDLVRDDEEVFFNKPVVMYVDNFLGFDVGEIVPIGYYDRNDAEWKAARNGVVIKLLDANTDGLVDGIDYTGDDIADDFNGNGSTADEVAGVEDFVAGDTYWRGELDHFSPQDLNWPDNGNDIEPTPDDKPEEGSEKEKDDEAACTGSYVKPSQQSFHDDFAVAGTDLTLHYSSHRTPGYHHKLSIQVSDDAMPGSVTEMVAILEIGGHRFTQTFPPQANVEAVFYWDGRDPNGNLIEGEVSGTLSTGYKYLMNYSSAGNVASSGRPINDFAVQWAVESDVDTGVASRDNLIVQRTQPVLLKNTYDAQLAYGWSLSNYHELGSDGTLYRGDGEVEENYFKSVILKTGITSSQHPGDDGSYGKGGSDINYRIGGDGVLVDTVTGLRWAYNETPPKFRTVAAARNYCEGLGVSSDLPWRLPTEKEAIYTIDKSKGDHGASMYNLEAIGYFRETTYNPTNRPLPVVCVSGESLNETTIERLVRDATREVVIDSKNGLMWQDDVSTQSVELPWTSAIDHCEALTHASFDDWRLPNINELVYTLPNAVFVNKTDIDTGIPWSPTAAHRMPYWSSTPNFQLADTAWAIESVGFSSPRFSTNEANHVRCVRDDYSALPVPYIFDEQGRHVRTIDINTGQTLLTFNHDADGQLVSMTNQFGQDISLQRSGSSGVSITGPYGHKTTVVMSSPDQISSIRYEDGAYNNFAYTGGGTLLSKSFKSSPWSTSPYERFYDEHGRVIQALDPEGGAWDFFNETVGPKSERYGYSTAENNTYQTLRSILENGDTRRITTEKNGTVTTNILQSDRLKETTEMCGVSTVVDNVRDAKTNEEIPSVITVTQPSGLQSVTQITKDYGDGGANYQQQTVQIEANGRALQASTDYEAGITVTTTPEGRITRSEFNPSTRRVTLRETDGLLPTTTDYDSEGRPTTITTGTRITRYFYNTNAKGQISSIEPSDGKSTTFTYDALGRVSTAAYPDGGSVGYQYDLRGNLTQVIVPSTGEYDFTFNNVDKPSSDSSPLNEATILSYDKDRRLVDVELPSGGHITNSYSNDQLSRVVTPDTAIDYAYACNGNVSTITEGNETLSFSYDGELLTGLQYSGDLGASISQQFNNDFVIDQMTYAGDSTSYVYDDDLLLTQANGYTVSRNAQHGLPETIADTSYQQQRSYNAYGEPQNVTTQIANNAAYSYTLTYNDLGLIVGKSEALHDGSTHQYVYTYDDNRRLKSVMKDSALTESYGYDHNGNRTTQTNTARGIAYQTASYNIADQLMQDGNVTYQYDVDGYLTQKTDGNDITQYQYSRQGRLLRVQTPTDLIEYRHNALGNRVAKIVNGQTTEKYLWLDKTTLLATYDGSGNLRQRFEYTLSHTPTSFTQSGNRYYIATDHLGSPRAISDEGGNIIKTITYDSYGNVISDSNPAFTIPFGYAGGLKDSDTGLIRFGFRDYDPAIGRWTARDPIGLKGGLNVYGYVLGNPINAVDVNGLETTVVTVRDWGVGTHSALHQESKGNFLYDPAGSYPDATRGSGDFMEGVSLSDYIKYHESVGSTVETTTLATTAAEDQAIQDRAIEKGGGMGGTCSLLTSGALGGVKGIPTGVFFPGTLAGHAKNASK